MKTITVEHKVSKKQFFAKEQNINGITYYKIMGADMLVKESNLKINWNIK